MGARLSPKMAANEIPQGPAFSPARSILFLGGVDLDFPEQHIEIAPNFVLGRTNNEFVTQLVEAGLDGAHELVEGLNAFLEFRGTTSTVDLLRPQTFATALIRSSNLAIHAAVHVIAEVGGLGVITGTRLPPTELSICWGHQRNTLTRDDITVASPLVTAIERVQMTDNYHRVGNALLFYRNGYNTDNPDLALVAFTTCLEGLFSTMEQEISFRLALRLAHFLGESEESRREKYEQCREVYKVRSKVVHGASVRKSAEAAAIYLVEGVVPRAEDLARSALRKILELRLETLFDQTNKVEALFEELLFSDSLTGALTKINR